MPPSISLDQFRTEIRNFLEETFARHHGIYLDKGTSFFETLDAVTAEEASRAASSNSASIAAHVKHAAFYLAVMRKVVRNELSGKVDWRAIWENARPVKAAEWDAIRKELRDEHAAVLRLLDTDDEWKSEFGGWEFVAIVVHTAYHLGAVRQILAVIRAS